MKGNIKKLAVLVIITVIAPFNIAVMASGGPPVPHAIQGQYAATGGGTCLLALRDIHNLKLNEPVVGWMVNSHIWEGVYTFEPDGTGSVKALQHNEQRPGPAIPNPPISFTSTLTWKFTYTVMDAGRISFTVVPGSFNVVLTGSPMAIPFSADAIPTDGVISHSGVIITVSSGSQQLVNFDALQDIPLGGSCSCIASLVLVRYQDTTP